ncbi:solute carrier family 2, facilitated glucose transporter member 3 isoform X5 [Macrobrachium rosenbergii]|uniref:solute carrier family 2, facilitated glucose transporter member 3 isoform X5 n=1 Tax=Macrobrachium rosenbergii TaxID=79674 RepID=UPI0034D3A19F
MCRSVGGGTAGGVRTPPCGIGVCMRGGGQRVSDTSISDGGRLSPSSHSFHSPHPPFVQQQQSFPYVVVPHPLQVVPPGGTAAAVAAAIDHAVFTSPVSPPAFPTGVLPPPIGTPPSPCYGGCSCGASTASSPGACRVHERVITCPPPPPLVTCGAADRDSVHGALTGGDGELAVPCNDDQEVWPPRDDTSEEIKEESVKELLLRHSCSGLDCSCSLTRRGGESMSECSVGCEPWRADQHPHNAHHGRDNTTPSSWTTFSNVVPFGSLQKQVSNMSLNLTAKIDEIQCHQHADTSAALHAIRTQLQELTKSVESCQSEVVEVKRDMVAIKHEIDTLQAAKEEIEELRDAVDRLEEQTRRRKIRLLEQASSFSPTGLTCFLCYAIFAAVLGMFQFGYNTGVINAPQSVIENFIGDCWKERYNKNIEGGIQDLIWSIAVSIFAIGGMIGGFCGGSIGHRFGRKKGLLLNNLLGVGGACLMGFSQMSYSFEMLILGRLVIGINCGLNTSLVPMYISEIAPLNLRGGLGTVNQLAVTVGLLLSQVLGIEQLLGNSNAWPILLGLAIVPAVMQMVLLPVCPESPRHLLITRQMEDEARRALRRLRASAHVEEDIEEMRAEEAANQSESHMSMLQLVRSSTLRMPLTIGIVMQLSQQLSGINAVLYYSTSLFTAAGLEEWQSKYATLGVGSVMVIMTLVSIPLMDRAGRRTLHLYGLGGMFIFSIFITISLLIKEMMSWMTFISVISTLCFVIFFSVGPGSIPWMITAELFSQGPRPAAMSIAVLVNWLSNFLVGIGFPKMQEAFENYTFLPFSALLACFWVFTYYKVPETKNKTFEEISAIFQRGVEREYLDDPRLYGSTLNCVNTLGSKPTEPEHAALIRELSSRAQQHSPSARSDRSEGEGGLGRRGSDGSESCGGSSRAESGVSSSRASSHTSSNANSSASSRQSVIAQNIPHPSEPPV